MITTTQKWNTKKELLWAEERLVKMKVQLSSGNFYNKYGDHDIKKEIAMSEERIRLSRSALLFNT